MNVKDITKLFIIIVTAIVIVFDIVVYIIRPEDGTISFSFWEWSQKYPPVPFLWGLITGHLFFPAWRVTGEKNAL